jgi:hypothetical protein
MSKVRKGQPCTALDLDLANMLDAPAVAAPASQTVTPYPPNERAGMKAGTAG